MPTKPPPLTLSTINTEYLGLRTRVIEYETLVKALQSKVALLEQKLVGLESAVRPSMPSVVAPVIPRSSASAAEHESLLGAGSKPRQTVKFDDVTEELRGSIDRFNATAREGKSQVVIERFEVELKAGVDVSQGFSIAPQALPDLKPEGLSVFRFTLRPTAKIKFADES